MKFVNLFAFLLLPLFILATISLIEPCRTSCGERFLAFALIWLLGGICWHHYDQAERDRREQQWKYLTRKW